jgi:hypothetical protein
LAELSERYRPALLGWGSRAGRWGLVTVDQLVLKHAVIGVAHDQFARAGVRHRQVRHAPGIVERLAADPLAAAG